jgi:hypothetical protein
MTQIFHPRTALLFKLGLYGALALTIAAALVYRLNIRTDAVQAAPIEQPVPFSHQHHLRDVGLDCRYCHTAVETSAHAGLPPVSTCMTCHSQLFTDTAMLAPVVEAYRKKQPLQWNRVHDLPDFVYFNHSIHVAKGVACLTCHGHLDTMPLTRRVASLNMEWCLDCHRHPERHLSPRDQVFSMAPAGGDAPPALGRALVKANHIRSSSDLTNCSTCHR